MLKEASREFLLAFGRPSFAPDEHLSSRQQDDWSSMTIKKTDVKNHLSTRAGTKVLQFRPISQPVSAGIPENELHHSKVNVPNSGADSGQPLPAEIPTLAGGILINTDGRAKISVIEKPRA
jgi:hypothetical protein